MKNPMVPAGPRSLQWRYHRLNLSRNGERFPDVHRPACGETPLLEQEYQTQ